MMKFTAILAAIDGKNNWDSPHYNEKSPEKELTLLKVTRILPPACYNAASSLKSHFR